MFTTVSAFIDVWRSESKSTGRVLACVPDSHLSYRPSGYGRSLGQLGWHIVTALGDIGGRAGLPVNGPRKETPLPASAVDIVSTYDVAARSIRDGAAALSDADLLSHIDVYGESWTLGRTLYVLVAHEIHHRGQLTVLLRLADLEVIGTYGPVGRRPSI